METTPAILRQRSLRLTSVLSVTVVAIVVIKWKLLHRNCNDHYDNNYTRIGNVSFLEPGPFGHFVSFCSDHGDFNTSYGNW